MIVDVQTLDDPRLDAYARLTDVQLRSRLEPERGVREEVQSSMTATL